MSSAIEPPYLPSQIQRAILWADLYLVDFAAVVPWIGLVTGQIFSPILGSSLGISSDIAFAIIITVSTVVGGYLLIRTLQKRRLASPAYVSGLSAISGPDERRNFDDRIAWLLKRGRPITRVDAIDTCRAAQKDVRRTREQMRTAMVFRAQKSTFAH